MSVFAGAAIRRLSTGRLRRLHPFANLLDLLIQLRQLLRQFSLPSLLLRDILGLLGLSQFLLQLTRLLRKLARLCRR